METETVPCETLLLRVTVPRDVADQYRAGTMAAVTAVGLSLEISEADELPEGVSYGPCPVCAGDDEQRDAGKGCVLCNFTGWVFIPDWWVDQWGGLREPIANAKPEGGEIDGPRS